MQYKKDGNTHPLKRKSTKKIDSTLMAQPFQDNAHASAQASARTLLRLNISDQ